MAASDAKPVPIKAQAYRVTFPIWDADGDLVTGAASLDSEVSKDAGTFADCTNEATEIAASSGMYYLDLTSTEMDADTVAIIVKTGTAGAKTTPIVLYPAENTDIPVNVTAISGDATSADNLESYTDGTTPMPVNTTQLSGDATAADNAEAFFDGTGYAGTNNVIPTVTTVNGLAANSVTASALAADAVTEIQSGLSTLNAAGVRSAVGLASANLDTQLDAVPTATENADALLNRDMSAVSDTNSRSPLNALRALRNKRAISGSTLTIYEEDDTTAAYTATVTTSASAEPVTAIDPA